MRVECVNPQSQMRFLALLRYYAHGDFARFCRAADLAYGLESTRNKFFCANLLLASQIVGLCEASAASGSTEWWVSHTGDLQIHSRRRKEVGISEDWFRYNATSVVPLAVNADGTPLILGSVSNPSMPGCFFDRALSDVMPAFKTVEQQLFITGKLIDEKGRNEVQLFRPESGGWDSINSSMITGPCLVRGRDQYSGWSYYISHADVGLKLRITQPEWAFVTAYHLLPWKLCDLFQVSGHDIEMHRAVRLPALALRTLFASAASLSVGPKVIFYGVEKSCIEGLKAYFAPARNLDS
jgi:hypothetical protein